MRPNFFDFEPYRPRGPYRPEGECSPCRELIVLLRVAAALSAQWLKRVRERRHLAALDHKMQRDIGVTPSEIAREIEKPFWRA
jgi:uncharacterized protein YjiS (DUF1127 family)